MPSGGAIDAVHRAARRGGPALAALGVLCTVYREVLFGGHAFFDRDIVGLVYGSVEAFVSCFRAGSWPLWNPWAGFGQPLLADPSYQALYPVTWLSLLLPATTWFSAYVLLHAAWGAAGLALVARALGLSRAAQATAAGLWIGAGPLLSMVDMWQHFAGAAWLPWSVLTADAALRRPTGRRTIAWGLVLALQVLCGSVEMLLLGGLLALGAAATECRERSAAGRRALAAVAAVAIAGGLTAVQWLPALDLLRTSGRADLPETARMMWSLQPGQLVQFLLPLRSSELPLPPQTRQQLWGGTQPMLESLYLGITTVPLVLASLIGRRRKTSLLLLALAATALLLSLGSHTPLLPWLQQVVPPLRMFRYPAKLSVLLALCWTLLSALGAETWAREGPTARRAWAVAVTVPSLILALVLGVLTAATHPHAGAIPAAWLDPALSPVELAAALGVVHARLTLALPLASAVALLTLLCGGARWRSLTGVALAFLACADVALANRTLSPTIAAGLLERPPASSTLMPRGPLTRIHTLSANTLLALPWRGLGAAQAWAVGVQEAMAGTTPVRWGYSLSFGGSFVVTPSPRYTFLTTALEGSRGSPAFTRLLQQAGVSYVIAQDLAGLEALELLGAITEPLAVPAHVLRVPRARPRCSVAGETTRADDDTAVRMLLDGALDDAGIVLSGERAPAEGPREPPAAVALHSSARIASYGPDRVEIEARLGAPGNVLLLDAWDEGWHATVDGQPVPVQRANVLFRAVAMPAGDHRVVMLYRPASLLAGVFVSTLSALALACAAGSHLLRARVRTP